MLSYDTSALTFGQIHIFLGAMESGSFTDAARRLNYTQSMVSKTIAGLERDLGIILFIRGKKLHPTPAAKILYAEWTKLNAQMERSIETAHAAQRGELKELVVGVADSIPFNPQFQKAIQEFSEAYPGVLQRYEAHSLSGLLNLAREAKLDVIITTSLDEGELRNLGYSCQKLIASVLTLFVHRSNPLSQQESVSLTQLRGENFFALSSATYPSYSRLLNQLGELGGFRPRITMYAPNVHSLAMNLLTGQGVVLADSYTDLRHADICPLTVTGLPDDMYGGGIVAWKEDNASAQHFVDKLYKTGYDQLE